MLKAIIADDEKWVCEMISHIIDWDNLGILLVGKAEDGITLFDLIQSEKPDIVITDIRMPGLDGIEIVKRTRELNMNTRFIIISGFKHFEYAHSALKYGVDDYLLKPIKEDELNRILKKIRDDSVNQSQKIKIDKEIHSTLSDITNKLKDQYLEKLLNGKLINKEDTNLPAINSEYNFSFVDGIFQVVTYHLDQKRNESIDSRYNLNCIEELSQIMNRRFRKECFEVLKIYNGNSFLLNYDKSKSDLIRNEIIHSRNDYIQYLKVLNCYDLTIGVGIQVQSINDIAESVKTSSMAVLYRISEGVGKIIEYGSLQLKRINLKSLFLDERVRAFSNSIEVLDIENISKIVNEILTDLTTYEFVHPIIYYEIAERIEEIFNNAIKKIHIEVDDGSQRLGFLKIQIENCKNQEEYSQRILDPIREQLNKIRNILKQQDYEPIRLGIKFISENYNKQISLNDLAAIVNLNPVYYSVIFKKKTGMNISEYIQNYRLDVSKELLKDCRYNVSQISEMVGYSDAKYFSRLFRKRIGINPVEFRKLHL